MATGRITKRTVEAIPVPREGRREYLWDDLLKGFGCMVTPAASRTYLVQYRIGGRGAPTRRFTIGHHGSPYTTEQARDRAADVLDMVRRRVDPVDASKAAVLASSKRRDDDARLNFAVYADMFLERHVARRGLRSHSDIEAVLRRDLTPRLGKLSIRSITKSKIQSCLDEIGDRSPSAANKAHKWLRKLLAFAIERGDIEESPMKAMPRPFAEVVRRRALDDDDLARVWLASTELSEPWSSFVQVLALTGQRLREVARMDWKEINLARKEWIIPADRAKNKRDHMVPLSAAVLAILAQHSPAKSGPVFSTNDKTPIAGFSKAKAALDAKVAKAAEATQAWVFHDLRRTLATGCQRLGFPTEHIEAVINHASGKTGGLVRTYQVHDFAKEKRSALDAWAAHVLKLAAVA